jgi:hypothetical protein
MNGEAKGEHVNQNGLKLLKNICFVTNTKHFYYGVFFTFCFTCSLTHSREAKTAWHNPVEAQIGPFGALELPLLSECMNVIEGYRSEIEIFALYLGRVVKQNFHIFINVHYWFTRGIS